MLLTLDTPKIDRVIIRQIHCVGARARQSDADDRSTQEGVMCPEGSGHQKEAVWGGEGRCMLAFHVTKLPRGCVVLFSNIPHVLYYGTTLDSHFIAS